MSENELVKVTLSSGAKLEINPAQWEKSKRLYQAIAKEAESLQVDPEGGMAPILSKVLFHAMSSELIEERIWDCMGPVTYNGIKVTKDTFEPLAARGDYMQVLFEVAVVNVSPFTKNLLAAFGERLSKAQDFLQSRLGEKPKTNSSTSA